MASTHNKRRPKRVAPWLLRKTVQIGYRRRAGIAALIIFVGVCYGGWRLWNRIDETVLLQPEYLLESHQIQVTPPPAWIRADVKAEALRDGGLDGRLSIADDRLAERLAKAFALHPWIARVDGVAKHYPARVTVDLAYRRPVAMVEVTGGLFPVDEEGVLLPSGDFAPVLARQYPRIAGIDTQPLGPVGTLWGDRAVVDGIRIAVALSGVWDELQLNCIRRVVPAAGGIAAPAAHFELITRNGTTIPWGHAPGNEVSSEAPLAQKLARLKKYVADYGGLDESARRNDLDLRVHETARTASRADK